MRDSRFEIPLDDSAYPAILRASPDPPERLYVIGNPECLRPGVAVIGARKATPYGLSAATMLAGWAARSGYLVVSGGAIGCDQAAHRAALTHGSTTVAVMAGGADVSYPSGATALLREIAGSGALISENPWGTRPQRWMFRKRNRIIAGMCAAVLVVEAGLPSGTFSTADDALAAGREVFAVPGSILSPESRGSNRLISQGATMITDPTDLMLALSPLLGQPVCVVLPDDSEGTAIADELLRAVRANPMRPEDAAHALGLDVVSVVRRFGALEMCGDVIRYPDGRYGASVRG